MCRAVKGTRIHCEKIAAAYIFFHPLAIKVKISYYFDTISFMVQKVKELSTYAIRRKQW